MKRIFFLLSALAISSFVLSMQKQNDEEAAKKSLIERYASHVIARFKPTTKSFMQQNPEANESKILQRYVDAVAKNAVKWRKRDLPLCTIGTEFRDALDYTPSTEQQLKWILTGVETKGCFLTDMPIDEWKQELQKIESNIEKK